MYKDGQLGKRGTGANLGGVIEDGGRLVLGHNQADLGEDKFFIGTLAHVNIWDYVLPNENISALSRSCLSGEGNVLKWVEFKQGLQGEVHELTPSPCQP